MAVEELVAGGALGAAAGVISAWLTARAQIKAVREDYEGRLKVLEAKRGHERERDAAAAASDIAERVEDLQRAGEHMLTALEKPDAINRNVTKAQAELENAAAAVEGDSEITTMAQALLDAGRDRDSARAAELLTQLRARRGSR